MLYYTRKPGKSQDVIEPNMRFSRIEPTFFLQGASAMKEKTNAALHVLLDFTAENLGFVVVWAAALAIILKLACV